jgi:hypothetical protein
MMQHKSTQICEGCYCQRFMLEREGCLYMFKEAYNRLHGDCPCMDCFVRIMCRDRYNVCEAFHNFLNSGMVIVTPESRAFKTF